MKRIINIVVFLIFIVHIFATSVILFGAFFPIMRPLYQIGLIMTIASWIVTKGCFLTVWEYKLRKIINPDLEIYEYGFIDYHLRKFFTGTADPKFIHRVGLFFVVASLCINVFFYGIAI